MKVYKWEYKNEIQKKVWKLLKKRDKLREQYGVSERKKSPDEYKEKVKIINKKLDLWRRKMVDIDKRRIQTIAIANAIACFTGFNVKNSIDNKTHDYHISRCLFIKYGMENGITGVLLAEYIGTTNKSYASDVRLSFTRSFEKNNDNRDLYKRFVTYMNELSEKHKTKNEAF